MAEVIQMDDGRVYIPDFDAVADKKEALEFARSIVNAATECRPLDVPPTHFHGQGKTCDCGAYSNVVLPPSLDLAE